MDNKYQAAYRKYLNLSESDNLQEYYDEYSFRSMCANQGWGFDYTRPFVLADEEDHEGKEKQKDTMYFGHYPQSTTGEKQPIEWIILQENDDNLLLLSKYALDIHRYFNCDVKKFIGNYESLSNTPWIFTELFEYLNSDFLNTAFSEDEKRLLKNQLHPEDNIKWHISNPFSQNLSSPIELVSSLSERQVKDLLSDEEKKCIPTPYAKSWYSEHVDNLENTYCWWVYYDGTSNGPFVCNGHSIIKDCGNKNDCTFIRPTIVISVNERPNSTL